MTRVILCLVIGMLLAPATARAQTEDVAYYHTDAIGSVRATTNNSGAVQARYDYLPFGELWSSDPPQAVEVRQFAGKERETIGSFDLDYFGARYHFPVTGRFTTVDPVLNIDDALLNPQLWNRYAYSLNNPLRFIDPDGRQVLAAHLQKMLELLKTPLTAKGAPRGALIQGAVHAGGQTILGELFGYNPMVFPGGLSQAEVRQLLSASSHEKGAWMMGVGARNAPA